MTQLGITLQRIVSFKSEIKACADSASRYQLTAAWKELILEDCIKIIQVTTDPEVLGFLDNNISVATLLNSLGTAPTKSPTAAL